MRSQPVRVAIDLETTGLHHEQDAIIEIGAVKFAGDEVLDTFSSLVSINMPLPFRIQRLTGIRPDELRAAPALATLHGKLRTFLGDAPLVGHNVSFDTTFLQKVGLARRNPLIDTWELASLLLPGQPSYTLGALGEALRIPAEVHHRALADADLTRALFLDLLTRIEALDPSLARTLRELPASPDWTPRYFLRGSAPRRDTSSSPFRGALTTSLGAQLALKLEMDPDVLTMAVAQDAPDDANQGANRDADNGQSSATEPLTPGVAAMAREMLATFDEGGVLLAEASPAEITATLEPMLRWLAEPEHEDERLLIAAATEEQAAKLARATLPKLLRNMGVTVPVAEMFAREAYACLHRWFGQARIPEGATFPREVTRGLARLAVWLQTTRTGARVDAALSGPEMAAWDRVRGGADHADAMSACRYHHEGYCFFSRARQAAQVARIIVTTHATLAPHLGDGNGNDDGDDTLPACSRVLVLDGRLFEENTRRAHEILLDHRKIHDMLTTLVLEADGRAVGGLLHQAAGRIERASLRNWAQQVAQARQATDRLFAALRTLQREAHTHSGGAEQDQRVFRLDAQARQDDAWADVAAAWRNADARLAAVAKLARETAKALSSGKGKQAPDSLATELSAVAWQITRLREQGARLLSEEDAGEPMVAWLRLPYPQNGDRSDVRGRGGRGQGRKAGRQLPDASDSHHANAASNASNSSGSRHEIPAATSTDGAQASAPADSTQAANPAGQAAAEDIEPLPEAHGEPTDIGALLAPLVAPERSLVLAGPALSVAGDFETIRVNLGLPEGARHRSLTADRSGQTLLCLPVDVPEPNAQYYQQRLNAALIALASALEGRLVAIFTSHAALRSAWTGIRRELEQKNILALAQGQEGSARQLWRTFETEERVVLLGAGSFWDGGEHTAHPPACVVVTRMPFPALSDPSVAARAERWPDPQSGFVVPQGALRLRQALNGLAWSHNQRNAVVLFDRRIQTRDYGPMILGTLPRCEQYEESLTRITERVGEWVDG